MARWRAEMERDVTYFDGCESGKYWVILFRLALLMPLKPSHHLLVRGSSPCRAPMESLSSRWPRLQTNLKDLWPEFAGHKQPAARNVVGNPIQGRMQRF